MRQRGDSFAPVAIRRRSILRPRETSASRVGRRLRPGEPAKDLASDAARDPSTSGRDAGDRPDGAPDRVARGRPARAVARGRGGRGPAGGGPRAAPPPAPGGGPPPPGAPPL